MESALETLRRHDIHPTAQRLAVAEYVLETDSHPAADRVWAEVLLSFPMISRATVYNTLNLFVEKGLVHQLSLKGGHVVFDPRTEPHHHLIDEDGEIHDIPWDAIPVGPLDSVDGFDIVEYQVVLHGRRKS